jgi:hypothetical protein
MDKDYHPYPYSGITKRLMQEMVFFKAQGKGLKEVEPLLLGFLLHFCCKVLYF